MYDSLIREPRVSPLAVGIFGALLYGLEKHDAAVATMEEAAIIDSEVVRCRAAALAAVGRLGDARFVVRACGATVPGVSISSLGQLIPSRNPEDLECELDHLRNAGLPEGQ